MEAGDAPAATATATADEAKERTRNRIKFETDLEFLQSLANPLYLHTLAQQNRFEDPALLKYLEYLKYWQRPEYARFVIFPQALHHLDLLISSPDFRAALKHQETARFLATQQEGHWATWRNDSMDEAKRRASGDASISPAGFDGEEAAF